MTSAKCSTCGAPICWLRTSTGKPMPTAPETVREGESLFVPGRHRSHFADCPQADEHRKPTGQRSLFGGEE